MEAAAWGGVEARVAVLRGWISASELIPPPGCTCTYACVCMCVRQRDTDPKGGGRKKKEVKKVKRKRVGRRDEPHRQDNTF